MKYKDSTSGNFEQLTVTAFDNIPIGSIIPFSGSSIPTGYMLCDGTAISRTIFSKLFSIIGTMYGTGDGSTTFNLPNLKGKVAVGLDSFQTEFNTLGETGGEKTHTLINAEMPIHAHDQYVSANSGTQATRKDYTADGGGNIYSQGCTTGNAGGGQAHNNLQPYLTVNYIIKVEQTQILDENVAQLTNVYNDDANKAYTSHYINERIEPVVLYNNTSGTNGDVTLSQSASNFTYMDIFYGRKPSSGNPLMSYKRVYNPDGQVVVLDILRYMSDSNVNGTSKLGTISGTTITMSNTRGFFINSTSTPLFDTSNEIYVYRVEGYKNLTTINEELNDPGNTSGGAN